MELSLLHFGEHFQHQFLYILSFFIQFPTGSKNVEKRRSTLIGTHVFERHLIAVNQNRVREIIK